MKINLLSMSVLFYIICIASSLAALSDSNHSQASCLNTLSSHRSLPLSYGVEQGACVFSIPAVFQRTSRRNEVQRFFESNTVCGATAVPTHDPSPKRHGRERLSGEYQESISNMPMCNILPVQVGHKIKILHA
jgi:hypothetical protein